MSHSPNSSQTTNRKLDLKITNSILSDAKSLGRSDGPIPGAVATLHKAFPEIFTGMKIDNVRVKDFAASSFASTSIRPGGDPYLLERVIFEAIGQT